MLQLITSLDFGVVVTGTLRNINFQLQNDDNYDITVSDIQFNTGLGYGMPTIPPYVIPAYTTQDLTLSFTAGAVGVTPASNLVIICEDISSPITAPITSESVANGKILVVDPTSKMFADTKVGAASAIQVFVLTCTGSTNVTVTGITVPVGWVAAAPVPGYPVVMAHNDTLSFGLKFQPVDEGEASDDLTVQSDAVAGDVVIPLSGTGFLITPAYIITGTDDLIFAFDDFTVKLMDPDDFNCESPGLASNTVLLPFQNENGSVPGFSYEKAWTRINFHYEDLGVAVVRVSVTTMRGQTGSEDVSIGTVAADGKIRLAMANMVVSDEVSTVTFTQVEGPVQIVDWVGMYVMKGERKQEPV